MQNDVGSHSHLPATMLAARYRTVDPDAGEIRVEEVERPSPGPGEVLVEVAVSGVNPTDWKARSKPLYGAESVITNQDGAGVTVAVGEGVTPARVGERVWIWQAQWQRPNGTAAQYCPVPAHQALPLPADASFDLGAGLGIPAMTAYNLLFDDGRLEAGDQILVQGGAGAVGNAAIELATHADVRVATTVSSHQKGELAAAAGAELVIDYSQEDVAAAVQRWAPGGVSRILEVNLAANLETDTAVIAPHGSVMVFAVTSAPIQPELPLMMEHIRLQFSSIYTITEGAKREAAEGVAAALAAGSFKGLPATRFPLAETAAAHDAVRDGAIGKVLIDVAGGDGAGPRR